MRAHHDQRRGAGADEEPLDAASRSTTCTSPACCGGCARASRRWTHLKPGRRSGGRRTSKHGGAEGPGRQLQRPAEAVPTCEQRDLDVTQALKADVGRQVQARGAQRPPTSSTSARTRGGRRMMDVFTRGRRGTSAEQERRDGGPRHQARRAGANRGRRDLGNKFATLGAACGSRAPDEAAPRTAIAVVALSLEGFSQMVHILPERLLALVRPAFDLVLRRIRSLKRCVQA